MELSKIDTSHFDDFYLELEKSFIEDERRDYADALRLFKEGKYEILSLMHEGKRVGFISLWNLPDFTFAEHFVIHESCRNLGFGAMALSEIKRIYKKIVLEAEPAASDIAKRRLAFYKRNGFFENEGDYTQPAFRKTSRGVKLVIMSFPSPLESFDKTVEDIKNTVYFDVLN